MKKKLSVVTDRRGMVASRVGGCTEDRACADSCSWVEPDLCSVCTRALDALAYWQEVAYRRRYRS
jgi:hypothetical protein